MTRWFPADVPVQWLDPVSDVRFVALTPAALHDDYAAVMRDIPMLRDWSGQDWPTPVFTVEENLEDLERHDREQRDGIALTYSVLHKDRVVGCIYVRPVVEALRTRDVEPPATLDLPGTDAAARGWAHEIDADVLLAATFRLLRTPPFAFTRLWWQTNTRCPAQLVACERAGLQVSLEFPAADRTWVFRSAPDAVPE